MPSYVIEKQSLNVIILDKTMESLLRKVVLEEINLDRGGDDAPQRKREVLIEAAVLIQHRQ